MAKPDVRELKKFLSLFPKEVQAKALWLRDLIWDNYPSANEIIYDNYNAVAVGWTPSGKTSHTFASIAVGRSSHNIHLGFYWGSKISDPKKMLIGEGNQYRYLLLNTIDTFPKEYARLLMRNAFQYSMSLVNHNEQILNGQTVVKSISTVKRSDGKAKLIAKATKERAKVSRTKTVKKVARKKSA